MKDVRSQPSTCSACGAPFRCGAETGDSKCWCFDMPKLENLSGGSCLCEACLKGKLAAQKSRAGG